MTQLHDEASHVPDDQAVEGPGRGLSPLILVAAAVFALAAGWLIGRIVFTDDAESMTGEVISDGTIVAIRDDTHVAAIDISESFPSYGVDARVVGFDTDGSDGIVIGVSRSTGADLNLESAIVRVGGDGTEQVLVRPENGLLGMLGVVGSSAIYQELAPPPGVEANTARVMAIDIGGGDPREIVTAPIGNASVGGGQLLYLQNAPCVALILLDLADESETALDPYPDEPGICWDAGVVTSTYLAAAGDRFVYLHDYNGEMQARVVTVDASTPDVLVPSPNVFSLEDVLDAAVQQVFERAPIEATVGADYLQNREQLE